MTKNCIISYATGENYLAWQLRLMQCSQFEGYDFFWFKDQLPYGARPHKESLYGFKIYAFKEAFKKGYENVLWLDAPCIIQRDPSPIFEAIEKNSYYLVHGEDMLIRHTNDGPLNFENLTRNDIKNWRLLSGSFIGLKNDYLGNSILTKWQIHEEHDLFLNAQQDCMNPGHRHDESSLSIIIMLFGCRSIHYSESFFQNENAIIIARKD